MEKGMIFDVWKENDKTFRAMTINETEVLNLETLEVVLVDFENEVEEILIDNIFEI